MAYLLCAATEFEIAPVRRFLRQAGLEPRWPVLVTGVGLLAATARIARYLAVQRPEFVLQAGVAGSLDDALPPGSLVAVRRDRPGDSGVQEDGLFRTLLDLQLQSATEAPWTGEWLENPWPPLESLGSPLVSGITVQEITTRPERADLYRGWGASVESLEGAALHFACLQEGIPFLQLRTVSNRVGERDKGRWDLAGSIATLNKAVEEIITQQFSA